MRCRCTRANSVAMPAAVEAVLERDDQRAVEGRRRQPPAGCG